MANTDQHGNEYVILADPANNARQLKVNADGSINITGGTAVAPLAAETLSNVANSLTNVTLLAANASRRAMKIFNDGVTGNLLVKHGATASATSFTVKIAPGGYYEMPQPVYLGIVDGIWDASGSVARITEGT